MKCHRIYRTKINLIFITTNNVLFIVAIMNFQRGNFRKNKRQNMFRSGPYLNSNGRQNFSRPLNYERVGDESLNSSNSTQSQATNSHHSNIPTPTFDDRNLKALLIANPRFHLVTFNGLPKYIKTSMLLNDLALSIPEIKPKSILSVHSYKNSANDNLKDFKIGFDSIKIIEKLEKFCGTGYKELYKVMVQFVMPDIQSNSDCEYIKPASDDLTRNKQPFKLIHHDTTLAKITEKLEGICGDKFEFITSICCIGEATYINVSHSALVFLLSTPNESYGFKIEPSSSIALTGTIPSELMPIVNSDTPINANATSRMTPEEIIKFNGFKSLHDSFLKEQKDHEVNLIKRSLLESQASIQRTLNDMGERLEQKLTPLEVKIMAENSRLHEIIKKLESNQNRLITMMTLIHESSKAQGDVTNTKRTTSKRGQRSVNPSTSGITDNNNISNGSQFNLVQLEEEIDNTQ